MTTMPAETILPYPQAPADGPQTAPEAPEAPPVDPAAPYGRTPAGRPRKKPLTGKRGRPKGSGTGRRQQRTSVIGAAGAGRRQSTKNTAVDYRPAILRAAGLVTVPLAFRSPVDAATIDAHLRGEDTPENPGLARALSNLAAEEPRVAAVLDRLMTAGPYAEVIGAALPMAVQLLTNHKKLPLQVAERLGAVDPQVIAQQLDEQAAQMAAAA